LLLGHASSSGKSAQPCSFDRIREKLVAAYLAVMLRAARCSLKATVARALSFE